MACRSLSYISAQDRRYTDTPLAHHNILLSERYKGVLTDIFEKKVLDGRFLAVSAYA